MNPLVSAVIPTKNEEANIGHCLESIRRQTYPAERIEAVVVDHPGTTDRTREIAAQYTDKIFELGPERSAQRNFGIIEKAQGRHILYLDADMILSSTVVEKAVELLENSDLVALYVPEIVLGNSFWSQVRRFERSFYDGTAIDCVRMLEREVFARIGGFDPELTGQEDWDLDKKVRAEGRVAVLGSYNFDEIHRLVNEIDYSSPDLAAALSVLSPEPVVYHNESQFELRKYLSKKGYYLGCFNAYLEKWGADDPDVKKQTGMYYRLLGAFVERGKWRRLLKYPQLAAGMYLLRFLVGVCYLMARYLGRK